MSRLLLLFLLVLASGSTSAQRTTFTKLTVDDWTNTKELVAFRSGNQFGYLDMDGNILVEPKFDRARPFSGGYAAVQNNGLWQYINPTGEITSWTQARRFEDARRFSEGMAPVRTSTGWEFIDGNGIIAIAGDFQDARPFKDGLSVVQVDGRYTYIDRSGRNVLGQSFDLAQDFNEGLAAVNLNGKWGFIDTQGHMVVEPQFDRAGFSLGGNASVHIGDTLGLVSFPSYGGVSSHEHADTDIDFGFYSRRSRSTTGSYLPRLIAIEFTSNPSGASLFIFTRWEWYQMKKANIDIFDNPHLDLLPYARGITSKTLLLIDDIYVVVGKLGNEIQPYLLNTITPESVNLEFTNE